MERGFLTCKGLSQALVNNRNYRLGQAESVFSQCPLRRARVEHVPHGPLNSLLQHLMPY